MKLASFFVVSFALHGVILTVPISFFEQKNEKVVPVALLMEKVDENRPKPQARVAERSREKKRFRKTSKQPDPKPQPERNDKRQYVTDAVAPKEILVAQPVQEAPPIKAAAQKLAESVPLVERLSHKAPAAPQQVKEHQTIAVAPRPKPLDQSDHAEDRSTSTEPAQLPEARFFQARYAYNPKPTYPDAAKREGWQGTVLLRVLINSQGEPATIEINDSSGFEILDQAALTTVRRWRFHPAHQGDQRIASWVKIPIVFRLADAME